MARGWVQQLLDPSEAARPFSFVYGGRSSAQLLREWPMYQDERRLSDSRTEHDLVWRDPQTGLVVRCEAIVYDDSPTLEWTVHFENGGAVDTPVLEAIRALDWLIVTRGSDAAVLHHNVGAPATRWDYRPIATPLGSGAIQRFAALGGRPTSADLPYFNLAWNGGGVIVVVGWPGQWSADFTRMSKHGVLVRAGQERTHFQLHPGERARTPRIVLQAWEGDWLRGQNLWRRWMVRHNVPPIDGRPPRPQLIANSSRVFEEMSRADEANQTFFIDRLLEESLTFDYWWMDAGWYSHTDWWLQTGTWEVDRARFPRGLAPISDRAHAAGAKTILWFEPERVSPGSWLADNHPEWVLGGMEGGLLDLGNPAVQGWVIDHVDELLRENRIDVYRQDLNIEPLPFWVANDAPDREGITENKHVVGYLAIWDELRRRHPGLVIDSCAAGGRRNDIESMRRAVPLWRSDYVYEPEGTQGMTYGLSMWLPFFGTGTVAWAKAAYYGSGWTPVEPYAFWSNAAPSLVLGVDVRERGIDYPTLRRLVARWRKVARFYDGDYYPLTDYADTPADWMAWQFHRPRTNAGVVQAFRRAECPDGSVRLRLHGLDPDRHYDVRALGSRVVHRKTGRSLMGPGMRFGVGQKPGAGVFIYRAAR